MSTQASLVLNFLSGKKPEELYDVLVEVLEAMPSQHFQAVLDAVLLVLNQRTASNGKASEMAPDPFSNIL